MKNYTTKNLGQFEIKSDKVMVSDPCYKIGTWCQGIVGNVKKGKWNAQIFVSDEGDWGNRVAVLIASHNSIKGQIAYTCPNWKEEKFEVGVDSGQAGIFDLKEFHSDNGDYNDPKSWYKRVCDLTLIGAGGIMDNSGVCSSSGFGDGGYICKTITKKNKVVAIMIDFCLLKEPDEEEDDMNDDTGND